MSERAETHALNRSLLARAFIWIESAVLLPVVKAREQLVSDVVAVLHLHFVACMCCSISHNLFADVMK